MQKFKNGADAHGHLADLRWEGQVEEILCAAQEQGVTFFMQGGVDPEDWQRQKQLSRRYPSQIGLCFGLHPYFVSAHSDEECDQALDQLAREVGEAQAVGEMGLDFRPKIMNDSRERQLSFFEQQLELAQVAAKPVVLHVVQAHEEALRVMDFFGLPVQGGWVHSFNGSWVKAQDFLKRNLMLSIGGPVCRPDNVRLHQAVREIPLSSLLIESDSPDQPPPAFAGQLNPPVSILEVARTIGTLKSLDPQEILDITSANLSRLLECPWIR